MKITRSGDCIPYGLSARAFSNEEVGDVFRWSVFLRIPLWARWFGRRYDFSIDGFTRGWFCYNALIRIDRFGNRGGGSVAVNLAYAPTRFKSILDATRRPITNQDTTATT